MPIERDYSERGNFHPWYARRSYRYASVAVAAALAPPGTLTSEMQTAAASGDSDSVAELLKAVRAEALDRLHVVDMCSGTGTVAAAAAALGCSATAIENQAVPHLIARLLLQDGRKINGWGRPALHQATLDSLMRDIRAGSEWILSRIESSVGDWSAQSEIHLPIARLWAKLTECPNCGLEFPLVSDTRIAQDQWIALASTTTDARCLTSVRNSKTEPTLERGTAICPRCGIRTPRTRLELNELRQQPLLEIARDDHNQVVLRTHDRQFSGPGAPQKSIDDLQVWATGSKLRNEIIVGDATTPMQREYFAQAISSVTDYEAFLDGQAGKAADVTQAVVLACCLLISAQAPYASTFATWDYHTGRARSGNSRLEWSRPSVFAEVSLPELKRRWNSNLDRLELELRAQSEQSGPIITLFADAGERVLPDRSADAVIWDPPYYENVDYSRMAGPHEWLLRKMPVPIRVNRRAADETFDEYAYLTSLRRQAERAHDLVRDGGVVAVFWPRKDAEGMASLLEVLAAAGLEIIQVLRFMESQSTATPAVQAADRVGTYLLIATKIGQAAAKSKSNVDASQVLELSDQSRPSLYLGLADVLLQNWDSEDLKQYIPASFRGTAQQRVSEFAASHPSLHDLLRELGRPSLKKILAQLGSRVDGPGSTDELCDEILRTLGFLVPRPGAYSPQSQLAAMGHKVVDLRLAKNETDRLGTFGLLASEFETLLRFCVRSWIECATSTGWSGNLDSILRTILPGRPAARMSMGDWKHAFCKVPGQLAKELPGSPTFQAAAASLKRAKIDESLSALVATRNAVVHLKGGQGSTDSDERSSRMLEVCETALQKLLRTDSDGVLPITVTPLEEIRDSYGRRRLVLADGTGRRYEVFRVGETDLTKTLVYLQSGANPRDVDPILITAPSYTDS